MSNDNPKHPIQPLVVDGHGVIRFKENKIVSWLLDNLNGGMNTIAEMDFTDEDREQFAQLVGYSHSGAGDLGYMSHHVLKVSIYDYYYSDSSPDKAYIAHLEKKLEIITSQLGDLIKIGSLR